MKKIKLSKEQFNILKRIDFSELGDDIVLDEDNNYIVINDYTLFCLIMTEEISVNGIGTDYEPNDYGRKLEALYDYIYATA